MTLSVVKRLLENNLWADTNKIFYKCFKKVVIHIYIRCHCRLLSGPPRSTKIIEHLERLQLTILS